MARTRCEKCQDSTVVFEGQKAGVAHAKVCSCSEQCGSCGGKGYVISTRESTFSEKVGPKRYEVLDTCPCSRRKERVALYNATGIPGAHAKSTLESFRPNTESQGKARETVHAFIHTFDRKRPNRGFVLGGPCGTGKTHLLTATLAYLTMELGVPTRYIEIAVLYQLLRRGFSEGKSSGELIEPLVSAPVLAIDELGKGRGSPFEAETMDELIARRYNAQRTTLIATNLRLTPPEADDDDVPLEGQAYDANTHFDPMKRDNAMLTAPRKLYRAVGARIYSRLCEMCSFVELTGARDIRRDWADRSPSPASRRER